ncbi:MAG: HAMP domain-containing sensor histidine kinase [Nocardioidaceae bacterium]
MAETVATWVDDTGTMATDTTVTATTGTTEGMTAAEATAPIPAETATEPSRHWSAPSFSVRSRITLAVSILTALALAGAGLLVYLLSRSDTDADVERDTGRVLTEFATFQGNSQEDTIPGLVRTFLSQEVPHRSELMVGYWDGGSQESSQSDRKDLRDDPAFTTAVEGRLTTGGSTTIDTQWGPVYLEVQPLADASREGAFVVAHFMADDRAALNDLMRTYTIASLLALILITGVAAWQAGRLLRPVRVLRETAAEIEAGDLSRRIPIEGNDDITELTRTFNAMLDRIQGAFRTQRAFLDDAGHELRTPLTILRGHIELLDAGDAEEVDRTRELLLDETDRMSRLVDELILLAKAENPDFVDFAECALGDLIDSVVDKARALGDRDWTIDQRADGTVVIDEQRITQALLQLADNAVKHTERGGLVAFGADLDAGVLRLWVRDDGPGVPDEYKSSIFERFDRGGDADELAGFGLGLSIVSAIAEGHRGTVSVYDDEPHGALFVFELPARPGRHVGEAESVSRNMRRREEETRSRYSA